MWQERLSDFVTLLMVINPVAVLPVFLALTGGVEKRVRTQVALRATLASFVILVLFIFGGTALLRAMGIALNAFQIAGGIVLFLFALSMVRDDLKATSGGSNDDDVMSLAIYPLAIPKIAGPGTMLTVVLLSDDDRSSMSEHFFTSATLAVVLVVTFGILVASEPIARTIGKAGASVIGRVMGMILAALAVNMVLTAVVNWLGLPKL
jgi:multiple antibiotic resistance protein